MFSKGFKNIRNSALWDEPADVRIVWITLLLISDEHGSIYATKGAISRMANIPQHETDEALASFQNPDNCTATDPVYLKHLGGCDWRLTNAEGRSDHVR